MKRFSLLFDELDQTTKTSEKVRALVSYFREAREEDKIFAIALLTGRRPKRPVNSRQLRDFAAEISEIPSWLFEESYHIVGDLAETIALLLPPSTEDHNESLNYWMHFLVSLRSMEDEAKKLAIQEAWMMLDHTDRFVFNKFITGGFRVGVSQNLVVQALAMYTGLENSFITHRLTGNWSPFETDLEQLLSGKEDDSKPYPFYLAYPLEENPESLGNPEDWSAELKWDGIRGQLIHRNEKLFLWSRGEELITDKFPEFHLLKGLLPEGTAIDGELLPYKNNRPLSFHLLQTRIGRKNVTRKFLEDAPVCMMAYDLLEHQGEDIRHLPFEKRRALLEGLLQKDFPQLLLSPLVGFSDWKDLSILRDQAREMDCEGLMLKKKDSVYKTGRKRGDWWKWKIDPMSIDAVMIYAQQGHGRRASLFTDYTFAVWDGERLVPFAKAYSGLTDNEIREVDAFVKQHTIEKFGPVRSVIAELVFEIGFEGIQPSPRHKSGIALRFPRILRWRKDKKANEANTLEDLKRLIPPAT